MGEESPLAHGGRGRAGAVRPVMAWTGVIAATLAEVYLVLMLTLAASAVLPLVFGWHATAVQSGSMRPHIDAGDVVVLAPWSADQPVPMGGVVQFRSPAEAEPDHTERLRLHRIVADNEDGTVVTAGDANAEADSTPLAPEQITGQARLLVPHIGLPTHWVRTGQWAPLSAWAAGTLSALVLAYAGLRSRENTPSAGDSGLPSGISAGDAPPDEAPRGSAMDRRHVLLGAGLLMALPTAAILHRTPPVAASFSARTTNAASTWTVATAAPSPLGRAADYLLLARSVIQNRNSDAINTWVGGSVGTSPGTTIAGFRSGAISGSIDRDTSSTRQGLADARDLHATLGTQPVTRVRSSALTGTVQPGVYTSSSGSFALSSTLTLDARGDADARFIFRATNLTTSDGCRMVLTGGARASNVFFRLTGSMNISEYSFLQGIYLARDSVVIQRSSLLRGHVIALNGRIDLTASIIVHP